VLVTTTTFPHPASVVLAQEVYDVNENRKVGALVQKDYQTVTACRVESTNCTSKPEFERLVQQYLID
jgi:hypothetical protein